MSGDPFGDDPYRGSVYREVGVGPCPRCDGPLMAGRGSLACPRGCGELLRPAKLPGQPSPRRLDACEPDVSSLIGRPFPPARCPVCRGTMEVRLHGRVVFDFCFEDGVWLDRGEQLDLDLAFADDREARAAGARDELPWFGAARARVESALLDADARPGEDLFASPGADEREERAWLDGERARLDDKRG